MFTSYPTAVTNFVSCSYASVDKNFVAVDLVVVDMVVVVVVSVRLVSTGRPNTATRTW